MLYYNNGIASYVCGRRVKSEDGFIKEVATIKKDKKLFYTLLVFLVLIGCLLVYLVVESSTYTTFGEAMSKMLEDEPIYKIMMSDANGEKAFDILDTETINSLVETSSEIRLKKEDVMYEPIYDMTVYTDEYELYSVGVDKDTIYVGGNFYSVKDG